MHNVSGRRNVVLAFALLLVIVFGFALQLSAIDDTAAPPQQLITLVAATQYFQLSTVQTEIIVPLATATRTPTPINLGNFVWDDIDHDGRQDAGEPGLSGVTVQLWNTAKTQLYDDAVTNASGSYTVVAPVPGQYRIRVVLPSAMDSFSPKDQAGGDDSDDSDINSTGVNNGFTDVISIANNVISISNLDAGVIIFRTPTPTRTPTPINLGNFVWDDIDHDGRQDAGEPGLSGVTVQLWNNAKTQMFDAAVTNASGSYTVIAPLPGQYRIRVVLPSAMDGFSPKDQAGGDDSDDSDINPGGANAGFTNTFTIANNVISISNLDAGVILFRTPTPTRTPTPINLGNFVWRDADEDGRQDEGEVGLSGVTVQLWNANKTQMIDATVTNASGNYTLIAPLPGTYRIRVVLPSAAANFSPKDQAGGDDSDDSDINPTGANAGFTDPIHIANNVISISNLDAGIHVDLVIQQVGTLPFIAANTCTSFRLTSPLDGLPNGGAAFYWNPAEGEGITYQVTVMDEAGNVLSTFEAGGATNVQGDVSTGRIGGSFQLRVRVTALRDGQPLCTDEHLILRAAPDPGAPAPIPTPTPRRRGG